MQNRRSSRLLLSLPKSSFMKLVVSLAVALVHYLPLASLGQVTNGNVVKIGGFRCVDLSTVANDTPFAYECGSFSAASFRMDIWKRNGVPFKLSRRSDLTGQEDTRVVRVYGRNWMPPVGDVVSASAIGGLAKADSSGNGLIHLV